MPQLDKVTFLSQFFWLCFFYLGFYYMILKFFLPKISRILALRRKKMGFSDQGMRDLQQENLRLRENYQQVMSRSLVTGKNLFSDFFSRTGIWLNTMTTSLNQTQFKNVNTSFIQSLGETCLSQNLLIYHAEKQLPEKLTFQIALKDLHTRHFGLSIPAGKQEKNDSLLSKKEQKIKKSS